MEKKYPTSVNVVSWFFIIIGSLSSVSGVGSIVVSISNQGLEFIYSSLIQVPIAMSLVISGIGLLKGSEHARKYLEIASYFIILLIAGFSLKTYFSFNSIAPLIAIGIYLVPFVFIIRALRSEIIRQYTS